jgi:O-antigen ligase
MKESTKNSLAFLYGLGTATQIRIIGSLAFTEIACAICAPFVIYNVWKRLRRSYGQNVVYLLLFWLISAVATDFFRNTASEEFLKGSFAILLYLSTFVCAFAILSGNVYRVRFLIVGIAFSSILSIFYFQDAAIVAKAALKGLSAIEVIDFRNQFAGIALLVSCAIAAVYYSRFPNILIIAMMILSIYYLYQGSRNGFLSLLFACSIVLFYRYRRRAFMSIQRNIFAVVILGIVLSASALKVYEYAAENGYLGEGEWERYLNQTDSDIGILESRPQAVAAMHAIWDSPILGHGSWARDKEGYEFKMLKTIKDDKALRSYRANKQVQSNLIPCHSHFWQAWVWHGVAGGIFWLSVFLLMVSFMRRTLTYTPELSLFNSLLFFIAAWDLWFSPMGLRARWGMIIALVVVYLHEYQRRARLKAEGVEININKTWDGVWRN